VPGTLTANVVRTDNYQYANGTPFAGGGNSIPSFLANGSAQFTLLSDYTLLSGNVASPHNFKVSDTYTPDIDLRNTSGTGMFTQGASATVRTAGTYNWTFSNTGNLTLPTNASNINYANGVSILNDIATTGNFAFDTADLDGTTFDEMALTGTNSGNILINADGLVAVLGAYESDGMVAGTGNVYLFNGDPTFVDGIPQPGVGYIWQFGNDANLTVPGSINGLTNAYVSLNAFNNGDNPSIQLLNWDVANAAPSTLIAVDPNAFSIVTNITGIGSTHEWTFTDNGQTVFPVLSTQRGDNPSGTISGFTLNGGDGSQEFIITTPDAPANSNSSSQRLVINPGAGDGSGEGGDIYLWAGRGGNVDGNGGDIKIRGGQGTGNGPGGYLRIEAGDTQGNGTPGYIDITGGQGGNTYGGYVNVTGGYGATVGGDVKIYGGYGQATGGNVNIWGGASGNGQINEGHVNIETGGNTWIFGADGNLAAPGAVSAVGNIIGGNITTGGIANLNSVRMSQSISWPDYSGSEIYEDGGLVINGPGGVYATGNIAARFEFNDGVGNSSGLYSDIGNSLVYSVGNVIVRSNNLSQTDWTFGNDGELYLPTGGRIGATKGGTMLDGGAGNITSLTSFYADNAFYSSCLTASPNGTLDITTYGNGTGQLGQWTFSSANLLLASQNVSGNVGESALLAGTRKIVNGQYSGAAYGYSAELAAGGTPSVAYTATNEYVQSVRLTFAVESVGSSPQWEQFDVVATKSLDTPGSVNFVVSNRIKARASIADTTVTATINLANEIEISLNLDAAQTTGGWSSFDAVEFGVMFN
jgi:hypothetical protein